MEFNYVPHIIKYFNIKDTRYDEIQVCCPYHEEVHPSASINLKKELFFCFAGCGGKHFSQLYNEVINNGLGSSIRNQNNNSNIYSLFDNTFNNQTTEQTMTDNAFDFKLDLAQILTSQSGTSFRILKEITPDEVIFHLMELIKQKGIQIETLQKIGAYPIVDPKENYYGYLCFPNNEQGKAVYRKFLPDDVLNGERYVNTIGEKPYYGTIDDKYKDYIIVEGIFDWISLMENGYENVICNLGTAFNDKRAFKFKGKVVFILFDNDFAGFTGAEKGYQVLRKIKAHPITLDLPERWGKDVNEAIKTNKEEFLKWLASYINKFDNDDSGYIDSFDKEENLYTLKTGLKSFDTTFTGGYKVGLHVIAAEPTVGKSALALYMSTKMVEINEKCKGLYITYEISKKQCWARVAAIKDTRAWNLIETDSIMTPESKAYCKQLSKQLRIESFWDISEIQRVSDDYDFFVIDYIQKMPADLEEGRGIAKNLKALSRLATTKDKIIIIVSSLNRMGYGKEALSIFKETGDIEYSVQSAILLSDVNHGGQQRMIKVSVLKNTRGSVGGSFWIEGNMLQNTFRDTVGVNIENSTSNNGDF